MARKLTEHCKASEVLRNRNLGTDRSRKHCLGDDYGGDWGGGGHRDDGAGHHDGERGDGQRGGDDDCRDGGGDHRDDERDGDDRGDFQLHDDHDGDRDDVRAFLRLYLSR